MLANTTSGIRKVNLPFLKCSLPENHVNQAMIGALERLVSAIYDSKRSYIGKIEVLMSVLECFLADCLVRVSPKITSVLFDFLLKPTLMLVFHGDWTNNKAVITHMQALFKQFKFRAQKKKLFQVVKEIEYLLVLMESDPWGNVVGRVLEGRSVTEEELICFVRKELGSFLCVRVEVLALAKCERLASVILEKCLECIDGNIAYFESFTEEVTYLNDLLLLIFLNNMNIELVKRKVVKMGFDGCLRFLKRCQNKELPFGILLKNTVDGVVTAALAEIKEGSDEHIQELITIWFDVFSGDDFVRMLKLLIPQVICPRYIYLLGEELTKIVQQSDKELVVEIFVRGLTLNVNEMEMCESNNDQLKVKELKMQIANDILQLGEYFKCNFLLYREFVLTSFSLVPSKNGLETIKTLGSNSRSSEIHFEKRKHKIQLTDKSEHVTKVDQDQIPSGLINISMKTNNNDQIYVTNTSETKQINEVSVQEIQKETFSRRVGKETGDSQSISCPLLLQISNLTLEENLGQNKDQETESSDVESEYSLCLKMYDSSSMGIPQTLCDDLETLINSIKNLTLTWELEWPELCLRCEKHLEQYESDECTYKYSKIAENTESFLEESICNRIYLAKIPSKSSKRKRKR